MKIRFQKGAGIKMQKCLVGYPLTPLTFYMYKGDINDMLFILKLLN